MSIAKATTVDRLEPLVCDSDNMIDVLMDLIERHFGNATDGGNHVLTETEGNRLFFVACTASSMSMKLRKAFYAVVEGDQI